MAFLDENGLQYYHNKAVKPIVQELNEKTTRVKLTCDDSHIYKDGVIQTYNSVLALVMDGTKYVTLIYGDMISFQPHAYNGDAIFFMSSFSQKDTDGTDTAYVDRYIINSQNQCKFTEFPLANKEELSSLSESIVEISDGLKNAENMVFDIARGDDIESVTNQELTLGIIRGRNIDNPTASTTNAHSTPFLFDGNFTVSIKQGYVFILVVHHADGRPNTSYPSAWTNADYDTSAVASNLVGMLVSVEVKKQDGSALGDLPFDIAKIKRNEKNNIVYKDTLQGFFGIDLANIFKAGLWGSNGTYTPTQTQSQYSTEIIARTAFNTISITPHRGFMVNVAKFDEGVFKSRGTWVSVGNTLTIDNSYDVSIIITKDTASSAIPVAEMLENYDIVGVGGEIEKKIAPVQKETDFMYHIMNCDTNSKVLHFSFDDIIGVLKNLNTETYTSIFEQYMLNDLKMLHDEYGCVFTLNCFCSDTSGFDISQLTTKYANQFQQNKDWLRFSFHAEDSNANYGNASTYSINPVTSYAKFVSGIYKLTGTYDCIDRFARLGYFGGTLEIINGLRSAEHGIIGLYSADDTRDSYYLDTAQNNIVINNGKLFDGKHEMVMIRSLPRLDNNDGQTIVSKISLPYQKYTEVFGHEYNSNNSNLFRTRIGDICEWAKENGYVFGFFDEVFA